MTVSPAIAAAAASTRTESQVRAERRYCQDCAFFAPGANGKEYGRCGAPKAEPVSNDRFIAPEFDKPPFASSMRCSSLNCGPDAIWFSLKQSVAA